MFKRIMLTTSALIAPALACAADLPTRSAPNPPALAAAPSPVSWTGLYAGFHAGVGRASADTTIRGADFGYLPDGFSIVSFTPLDGYALSIPDGRWSSQNAIGALAGGQVGYNWQVAPSVVIGAELDWSWAGVDGTAQCGLDNAFACRTRTNWITTASARFGFAFDSALLFAKAGVAYADAAYGTFSDTYGLLDERDRRLGFLVGTGLEYRLNRNWSAKVEYSYIGLGSKAYRIQPSGPLSCAGECGSISVAQSFQIVKVGVNYHFGGASGGVLAR